MVLFMNCPGDRYRHRLELLRVNMTEHTMACQNQPQRNRDGELYTVDLTTEVITKKNNK